MRKILLDTNFILTCIKNKIDLFEEFFLEGYKIIIPEQVIKEIKKYEKKPEGKIALKILEKDFYEKPDIGSGRGTVDNKIVKYAMENPGLIVATLDREIKNKLKKKNKVMVIRNKKKLEII
jgi:rRNA-processing protein FCF1